MSEIIYKLNGFESSSAKEIDAQNQLGLMYYEGKGLSEIIYKLKNGFEKAAKQGHAEALYFLGTMYFSGEVVPQDIEKSIDLFAKAAKKMCFLGIKQCMILHNMEIKMRNFI